MRENKRQKKCVHCLQQCFLYYVFMFSFINCSVGVWICVWLNMNVWWCSVALDHTIVRAIGRVCMLWQSILFSVITFANYFVVSKRCLMFKYKTTSNCGNEENMSRTTACIWRWETKSFNNQVNLLLHQNISAKSFQNRNNTKKKSNWICKMSKMCSLHEI